MMNQYHVPGKAGLPGNLFEPDKEYYKHDWQWFFPKVVQMIPDGSMVLDVGSGSGGLASYLKKNKNCTVVCCDMSDDAIRLCHEKGLRALKIDVENDNIPGRYDVVLITAVLEHLINPRHILWKLRNNLREGGVIILAQSNFSDILSRLRYLVGYDAKYYEEPAGKDDRGVAPGAHLHLFSKHALQRLLYLEGYQVVAWDYDTQPYAEAYNPANPWWRNFVAWIYHATYNTIHNDLFAEIIIVKATKI
jgi:SAM-dependent methyltransferase